MSNTHQSPFCQEKLQLRPHMDLLKASLGPSRLRQVSGGARETGRKLGTRTQDTGSHSSNSRLQEKGTWDFCKPQDPQACLRGAEAGEEAGALLMPGGKPKGWDMHLSA